MSIEVRPVRDGDFFAWLDLYAKYAEFYETELTDQKALVLWSWLTDPDHDLLPDRRAMLLPLVRQRRKLSLVHSRIISI